MLVLRESKGVEPHGTMMGFRKKMGRWFPVAGSWKLFKNQGNWSVKLFTFLWFKHPPSLQIWSTVLLYTCFRGKPRSLMDGWMWNRNFRWGWKEKTETESFSKSGKLKPRHGWNSKSELCRRKSGLVLLHCPFCKMRDEQLPKFSFTSQRVEEPQLPFGLHI